jgi:hypothetical protein
MELGTMLLKPKGILSFIVPNSWLKNLMFDKCRSFVLNNLFIETIIPNLDNVFTDASVDTLIFVASKSNLRNENIEIGEFIKTNYRKKHNVNQNRFLTNDKFVFDVEISQELESIFKKIENQCTSLTDICDITRGINPYDKYRGQSAEVIKNKLYHSDYKKDSTFVPEIRGKHVYRYSLEWDQKSYVSYGNWLAAAREPKFFIGDRIICRQVLGDNLNCTFIDSHFIIDQSVFIAKFDKEQKRAMNPQFVLAQLSSKLISFYFKHKANEFDSLFPKIKIGEFKLLPVKKASIDKQLKYAELANKMLELNRKHFNLSNQFIRYFFSKLSIEASTKNLKNWPELEFNEFIKELNKAIKKAGGEKLSKTDEFEWLEFFENKKAEVQTLKSEIEKTDKEIDQMVYELYGLTEEEIEIIERSFI